MNSRRDIDGGTRNRLARLWKGLEPAQSDLSLPQLLTLIAIAVEPGLSVSELAERLTFPQQTASRHVAALLGRYQTSAAIPESDNGGRSKLDALIVQEINHSDPRSRALFLSQHGYALLNKMISKIHG